MHSCFLWFYSEQMHKCQTIKQWAREGCPPGRVNRSQMLPFSLTDKQIKEDAKKTSFIMKRKYVYINDQLHTLQGFSHSSQSPPPCCTWGHSHTRRANPGTFPGASSLQKPTSRDVGECTNMFGSLWNSGGIKLLKHWILIWGLSVQQFEVLIPTTKFLVWWNTQ